MMGGGTFFQRLTLPIPFGPNRGRIWLFSSHRLKSALGVFEHDAITRTLALLKPGDVFWDVGANVGYYTLAGANTVGPAGHVLAIEPLERNVAILREHVRLNAMHNVTIVSCAVSNRCYKARFSLGEDPTVGRLMEDGELSVEVCSMDELLTQCDGRTPDVIKIDIEGEEREALLGAGQLLNGVQPELVISIHSQELLRDCSAILRGIGYNVDVWSLSAEPEEAVIHSWA